MAKVHGVQTTSPLAFSVPQIHAATLGGMGDVNKGQILTLAEAVAERKQGKDVVVCGSDVVANMKLAQQIEGQATGGQFVFHSAHRSAGQHALSHFQPRTRGPSGHTFVEAPPKRTAR